MGNNQSNERQKNWKIFKVVSIRNRSQEGFISLHLDDYVTYNDGNYKHINFDKGFFFGNLFGVPFDVGSYVKIDLNRTSKDTNRHGFEWDGEAAQGINKQLVVEKTDSNGKFVRELLESCGDIGEMLEDRRKLVASIEQSHRAENNASLRWTSWDMPPGWK